MTRLVRAGGWVLAGAVTLAALWLGSWLGFNAIDPAVQVIGAALFVLGVGCAVTFVSVAAWHWDDWLEHRRSEFMTAAEKIGAVEILRTRIYSLDAESYDENRSTVIVEPGVYDLYRDGMTTYWIMRGRLNQRGVWRMGDGMFSMHGADVPSPIEVMFPSRRFGPDEWQELLAGPEFVEGPEQRLRVLDASAGGGAP